MVSRSFSPSPSDPIRPDDRFVTADIPFRILCRTGRVLGSVATLREAMENFDRWPQASAITLGVYVVMQKGGRP